MYLFPNLWYWRGHCLSGWSRLRRKDFPEVVPGANHCLPVDVQCRKGLLIGLPRKSCELYLKLT